LPRRGSIYCSIACSKGEPPTPTESSVPSSRPARQNIHMQQSTSTNRTASDNDESIAPPSTPPTSPKLPSSPVHQQLRQQQQPIRSPKMGRRALHCSPKQSAACQTASPYLAHYEQQHETIIAIDEPDQNYNRGLDRVLLERNIEKLLERNEKLPPRSPQMNRLLQQDIRRQPLNMTDVGLSLDNLSPKTRTMYVPPSVVQRLSKDPMVTSSMPELPVYEISKMDDITPINEELPTPDISELSQHEPSQPIVIPTTSKKEVRFEGEYQDTLPRSRSYSGKAQTRNSGRRRKGSGARQRRCSSESKQSEQHSSKQRSSRNVDEPTTSTQANVVTDDDDDTETTRSLCSTCSDSSSDSDDVPYELPQRTVYGGVRVNYVPNDALACARKEQQQQLRGDQSASGDKNCVIS